MLMTEQLASLSGALLIAPIDIDPGQPRLDDHGHGYSSAEVDRLAVKLLQALVAEGARTLVVEDDLARRGDPRLEGNVGFVEDRVVKWAELDRGTVDAVTLLRSGSSGYPLNAFVSTLSARELMLEPRSQLRSETLSSIVRSVVAVIASVYDAEAYVALLTDEALEVTS